MQNSRISSISTVYSGYAPELRTSNATGFVPISCPTHPDYSITNICKAINCIEPLCPECITAHVKLHQTSGHPVEIENIVTRRTKCIETLAKQIFETQEELEAHQGFVIEATEKLVNNLRHRFKVAKTRILKEVEEKLRVKEERLEVLIHAYEADKEAKQADSQTKCAPLLQYLNSINSYKSELESDEYIPALIELLNTPPRRPPALQKLQLEDYGTIVLDEGAVNDLKNAVDAIVNVDIKISENKINFGRQNFHESNNMKFSRSNISKSFLDRSNLSRSKSPLDKSRAKSKTRIFGNGNDLSVNLSLSTSEIQPTVLRSTESNISKKITYVLGYSNEEKNPESGAYQYFIGDEGKLIFCDSRSNCIYRANIQYPDSGFDKTILKGGYVIPQGYSLVVTSKNEPIIIGGIHNDVTTELCYQISEDNRLLSLPPMIEARAYSSCCFSQRYIYAFGGIGVKGLPLQTCERFDKNSSKWVSIAKMLEPSWRFNVCPMGKLILKFGGQLSPSQILSRLDIYDQINDDWSTVEVFKGFPTYFNMGVAEITPKSIIIFGGEDQFGSKVDSCHLLVLEGSKFMVYQSQPLRTPATFDQTILTMQGILAIQIGEKNCNNSILSFKQGRWRFIGC